MLINIYYNLISTSQFTSKSVSDGVNCSDPKYGEKEMWDDIKIDYNDTEGMKNLCIKRFCNTGNGTFLNITLLEKTSSNTEFFVTFNITARDESTKEIKNRSAILIGITGKNEVYCKLTCKFK
uniref:Uncharacterized protein n=1 Tax=Strongyloides venezuelensis TaxID=75913 RepID=A0A0K0FGX4_STRVS